MLIEELGDGTGRCYIKAELRTIKLSQICRVDPSEREEPLQQRKRRDESLQFESRVWANASADQLLGLEEWCQLYDVRVPPNGQVRITRARAREKSRKKRSNQPPVKQESKEVMNRRVELQRTASRIRSQQSNERRRAEADRLVNEQIDLLLAQIYSRLRRRRRTVQHQQQLVAA